MLYNGGLRYYKMCNKHALRSPADNHICHVASLPVSRLYPIETRELFAN